MIYVFSPNADISCNRVVGNEIGRALGWGGGITVVNKGSSYKLSHNLFTGNFAPSVGSTIFVDEAATASLDHDLIYAMRAIRLAMEPCRQFTSTAPPTV